MEGLGGIWLAVLMITLGLLAFEIKVGWNTRYKGK